MKYLKIAWSLLFIYSVFHLLFSFSDYGVFTDLIRMEGNLLALSVFNLMGLFPLAFLVFIIKYERLPLSKNRLIGVILSFMTGAFALYPVYFNLDTAKHLKSNPRLIKSFQLMTIIFGLMSIILVFIGVIFGDFKNYIFLFSNDSLIHIMTIDFIMLYALSIYVLKRKNLKYRYAILPVFGFYYALFLDNKG